MKTIDEIEEAMATADAEVEALLAEGADLRAELSSVRADLIAGVHKPSVASVLTNNIRAQLSSLEATLSHRRSELSRLRSESLLANPSATSEPEQVARAYLGQHPATPATRLSAIQLLDQIAQSRVAFEEVPATDFDSVWGSTADDLC